VNPTHRNRSGLVELVIGGEDTDDERLQVVSERTELPGSMTLDANTVRTVLGLLQGPRIDNDAWVHDVRIDEDAHGIDLTVTIGPEEREGVPIAQVKQDLYTRLGARPDVMVTVNLDQPPDPPGARQGRGRGRLRLAVLRACAARAPGAHPARRASE